MKIQDRIILIFVTFFGLGRLPIASGTWGTLGAIPVVLLFAQAGPYGYMGLTLVLSFLAIVAADLYQKRVGGHDKSEIVIDEVAGYLVTMTWVPLTWQSIVIGFFLFRILDILKPYPIGKLDEKVKGGFGVVVDDLAAGVVGNIILQLVFTHTDWLGRQLAP